MDRSITYLVSSGDLTQELRMGWDGAQYVASVASVRIAEPVPDLIRPLRTGGPLPVAHRPAQRFRADRWRKFVDDQLRLWSEGQYDDLQEQATEQVG